MRSIFRKPLVWCILLCLLAINTAVSAQEVVTADEVNAIAKGLYCPVCESEPLDTCATQACIDWREEIRVLLEEGATEDEVYAYFQNRYGDRVLSRPPLRGSSLVLWVGLPLVLVGAGFGFFRYLRQIEVEKSVVAHPVEDNAYIRQVERELAERE